MQRLTATLTGGIVLCSAIVSTPCPGWAGYDAYDKERQKDFDLALAAFERHLNAAADAARRGDRKQAQRALRGALLAGGYNFEPQVSGPMAGCGVMPAYAMPRWLPSVQARIGDTEGALWSARAAGGACEMENLLRRIAHAQEMPRLPSHLPRYPDGKPNYYDRQYVRLQGLFLPPRPAQAAATRRFADSYTGVCGRAQANQRRGIYELPPPNGVVSIRYPYYRPIPPSPYVVMASHARDILGTGGLIAVGGLIAGAAVMVRPRRRPRRR